MPELYFVYATSIYRKIERSNFNDVPRGTPTVRKKVYNFRFSINTLDCGEQCR